LSPLPIGPTGIKALAIRRAQVSDNSVQDSRQNLLLFEGQRHWVEAPAFWLAHCPGAFAHFVTLSVDQDTCGIRPGRTMRAMAGVQSLRQVAQLLERKHILSQIEKALYTGRTHTTGGRDGGGARSDDGHLEVKFSTPGSPGSGTNPEQMFAAGWSACFIGAMGLAARKMKVAIPADTAVDAEVDLCLADGGYFLQARLNVSLPGLERDVARAVADAAHQTCPYSKATRGNIDVVINVV
jgi:Ohr subfamily peroxiredoxin